MTVTSSLGFDPIWSNFNITGVSAGGATLLSTDSLNPTVLKSIFSDPGLNFPYPNPLSFDQNGNAPGPFYFALDSLNPTSLYDLFLYDTNGNLIWNVNSYFPSGGSGGSITTVTNVENLIINNVFWRNIGGIENPPVPVLITDTKTALAPSAHDGLSANIQATEPRFFLGPDIYLIKNNTSANETVTFFPFTLGSVQLTSDITPIQYVQHSTNNLPAGETYKYYQFPVNAKVQNLTNTTVTITLWAQGVSGTQSLFLQWASFYGDGTGASTTDFTPIATQTLTNSWAKYSFTVTVPNVAGKSLGQCGNDGLFLLIGMPLNAACVINFIKPSLYIGSSAPQADFTNYDNIDAAINSPRTGDVRTSLNNFLFGYVPMNDGTIGSKTSSATTRAKTDTFPLYNLLWNSINNAWAPMADGAARGVSAVIDFSNNRAITLTKALGRVFAGTLNTSISQTATFPGAPTTTITLAGGTAGFGPAVPVIFAATGGGTPTLPGGITPSQSSATISITYYANILSGTTISISAIPNGPLVTITNSGIGTITAQVPPYPLGAFAGEELHTLNPKELANHTHDPVAGSTGYVDFVSGGALAIPAPGSGGNANAISPSGFPTGAMGLSLGHNTIQPTTYMNVFIKL